jgi:hypothetical protein
MALKKLSGETKTEHLSRVCDLSPPLMQGDRQEMRDRHETERSPQEIVQGRKFSRDEIVRREGDGQLRWLAEPEFN